MYIILKNCELIECASLMEVGSHYDIKVNEQGRVFYKGILQPTPYRMGPGGYTQAEALADFVKNKLCKVTPIYKAEKL